MKFPWTSGEQKCPFLVPPPLSLSSRQDKCLSPPRAGTCFFPESFVEEGMEGAEVGFSWGQFQPGLAPWETGCGPVRPSSTLSQAVSYFQRSVGWLTLGNSDKHIVLKCKLSEGGSARAWVIHPSAYSLSMLFGGHNVHCGDGVF